MNSWNFARIMATIGCLFCGWLVGSSLFGMLKTIILHNGWGLNYIGLAVVCTIIGMGLAIGLFLACLEDM